MRVTWARVARRPGWPLWSVAIVLLWGGMVGAAVYLERRPPTGIWGGLWSLPELERGEVADWCEDKLDATGNNTVSWGVLRHSFSHYDLDIRPVVVHISNASRKVADSSNATWHRLDDAPPGGIAAPVQKLIESLSSEIHVKNH